MNYEEKLTQLINNTSQLINEVSGKFDEWDNAVKNAEQKIDGFINNSKNRIGFNLMVISSGYGGGTNNTHSGVFINGVRVATYGRSQNVGVIDISQEKMIEWKNFDTYGNKAKADECANYIKELFSKYTTSNYLFVFWTYDEPAYNINDNLKNVMINYFKAELFHDNRNYRDAYLCIYRQKVGKLDEKKSRYGNHPTAHVSTVLQIIKEVK